MRSLEDSYAQGKISQSTYEYLKKVLANALEQYVTDAKRCAEEKNVFSNRSPVGPDLANQLHIQNQIKSDKDNIELSEPETPETLWKKVGYEKAFHFCEDMGKSTGKTAFSLEDLVRTIQEVSLVSLEFHQKRGDFANWIWEVLGQKPLASAVRNVMESGENLRTELIKVIPGAKRGYIFPCPNCGKDTAPGKTWTMIGKPNKKGERHGLSLGYYKCPNCGQGFRQVLAKLK